MEENKITFSEEVNQELKEIGMLYKSFCSIAEEIYNRQRNVENLLEDQLKDVEDPDLIFDELQKVLEKEIGEETSNKLKEMGMQ